MQAGCYGIQFGLADLALALQRLQLLQGWFTDGRERLARGLLLQRLQGIAGLLRRFGSAMQTLLFLLQSVQLFLYLLQLLPAAGLLLQRLRGLIFMLGLLPLLLGYLLLVFGIGQFRARLLPLLFALLQLLLFLLQLVLLLLQVGERFFQQPPLRLLLLQLLLQLFSNLQLLPGIGQLLLDLLPGFLLLQLGNVGAQLPQTVDILLMLTDFLFQLGFLLLQFCHRFHAGFQFLPRIAFFSMQGTPLLNHLLQHVVAFGVVNVAD